MIIPLNGVEGLHWPENINNDNELKAQHLTSDHLINLDKSNISLRQYYRKRFKHDRPKSTNTIFSL